jgi:hypothetical protein
LAASPDEHTSAKKSRILGPAAVLDVASTFHKMASFFNDPSTPQCQLMAIHAVEKDQELNSEERIKATHLFKHVHAKFIHLEIEDF